MGESNKITSPIEFSMPRFKLIDLNSEKMIDEFVPIFYSRGFNEPFIEGHIQILRMIVKALSYQNVKSVVFNYQYGSAERNLVQSLGADCLKIEQKIPFLGREEVISAKEKSVVAWASLFEAIASLRFMSAEKRINKRRRIVNIINCFRYPRLLAKAFLGAPVLLHLYKRDALSQLRSLTRISDLFLVTSNSIATHLKCEQDVPGDKINLVYPPIDTDFFKPLGKKYARNLLRLPGEAKIILYLGNLDVSRFPEMVALGMLEYLTDKHTKVVMQIYTSRSINNVAKATSIAKKAKSLGLSKNVSIQTRNLSDIDKSLIYSAADAFFFPSTESGSFVEPPLSVLEAMSTGLPTVSRNISSLNELFSGKSRDFIVCSDADIDSFSDKMDQLLSKPDAATESGINSRKAILRNASLNVVGTKLCGIYRCLLE